MDYKDEQRFVSKIRPKVLDSRTAEERRLLLDELTKRRAQWNAEENGGNFSLTKYMELICEAEGVRELILSKN